VPFIFKTKVVGKTIMKNFLSNYQCLPRQICVSYIETTSQSTLSLYFSYDKNYKDLSIHYIFTIHTQPF